MPLFTDQTGYGTEINGMPKRIVSLVPSQTELLYDLGLDDNVSGITKFCVHPDSWFRTKIRIGGTKNVKKEIIDALDPDLIIASKEENVKEQVEELRKKYPVWVSDVITLQDAVDMIRSVGEITHTSEKAGVLVSKIEDNFSSLSDIINHNTSAVAAIRTAYLIWREPYMAAGGDTFINSMLQQCGLKNIYADSLRYPVITIEDLTKSNCQLLLLSSEPFPFRQQHLEELQAQLPNTKIILADGEFFSWYGSRLVSAPGYFRDLLQRVSWV